ncbi:hypothetical protein B0O99DRAFT_656431 [Bisporella sp. PMI_857]|nr:hypothetical protein B0O99DRAFT_656431 [Bisporella sp. PMI_857]
MSAVRIVEVGPRDGLQNISQIVPTKIKIELIKRLAACGYSDIEATSFVSPKWVPQLADAKQVLKSILPSLQPSISFPVLVPNVHGLELAHQNGVKDVAVFVSAAEGFSKKNINCSVEESIERIRQVANKARLLGIRLRGYVSCIFEDPYSGPTRSDQVIKVTRALLDLGCYEVSLGDTTGVGTPADVKALFSEMIKVIPAASLAGHFHDTYGQAIANVVTAYGLGIRTFDSSVAGLGGCPFAKGAKGNLATEDLIYTLNKMGVTTGVDLHKVVQVGSWISGYLQKPNESRAGAALNARQSLAEANKNGHRSQLKWDILGTTKEYRVSRSGANVKICLSRPKNGNALTTSMILALTELFKKFSHDNTVSRIALTAEGKYFCTGMDLSKDQSAPDENFANLKTLFEQIDNCPQTTIAAINGPCFGGGVGLAFACDLRIVTENATFKLSEVNLGLCPATISKYIVREWGISFARSAMLTAREVKSTELLACRAVHAIVPATKLDEELEILLYALRYSAPKASALSKYLVKSAWTHPGREEQAVAIKSAFYQMMAPGQNLSTVWSSFARESKGLIGTRAYGL